MKLDHLDFTTGPRVRHSLALVSLTPPTGGPDARASPEPARTETSLGIWASRIAAGTDGPRVAINIPITATMHAVSAEYRPREVLKEAARSLSEIHGDPLEGHYAVGLPGSEATLFFSMDRDGRPVLPDAPSSDRQSILKAFQMRRQIERLQIEPMSIDKSIPQDFAGTLILRGHSRTATLQDIVDSVPRGFQGLLVYSDCDLADLRLRNLPEADVSIANCRGVADAIFPAELSGSLGISNTDLGSVRLPRAIGGHMLIDGCPTDYATVLPDRVTLSFTMVGRFGESRESLLMTALPMQVGLGMDLENIRATMTPFPDLVGGPLVIRNCDLSHARIDTDTPELRLIESDITRLELGARAVLSVITIGCFETIRACVPDLRYSALNAPLPGRPDGRPFSLGDVASSAQPAPHGSRADLDRFAETIRRRDGR